MAKKLRYARVAVGLLIDAGKPDQVLKVLRPAELQYLCDLCDALRDLRLCDDVFFDEDEDDAETDL